MLMLYAMVGQEPSVPDRATLVLRPSGDIPEVLPDVILGDDELTVRAYVELIRKAKGDSRIAGILLRPGGVSSPFWGKLQEIRSAIEDFKSSGKFVHAWLEYAGDREYYLASVADRVFLLPSASLDLTGVATYEIFLRGTFDWIGRSEEHTSELQSRLHLVCRLLLEKKKTKSQRTSVFFVSSRWRSISACTPPTDAASLLTSSTLAPTPACACRSSVRPTRLESRRQS